MNTTPPTEPVLESLSPAAPDERIRRLERRVQLLVAGLVGCGILLLAVGGVTGILLARHATLIAERAAQDSLQLDLLRAIRKDFEAADRDQPQSTLEAYTQLREQLHELQQFYGSISEFDPVDMEGSLDRLLGETTSRSRRQTSDPTPIAPPREENREDESPPRE